MTRSVILKADTFRYPTKEERKMVESFIPKIHRFRTEYNSAAVEVIQGNHFENAVRGEDLYWWESCINNRVGKLAETFVYVQTHYLRQKEMVIKNTEDRSTDRILLDYFIEVFYYFFFSSRDILGQYLNVYYKLGLDEHKVFLNDSFVQRIESEASKVALTEFLNSTKDSYNIRNSFNHRFTPSHTDRRAKTNVIRAQNVVSFNDPVDVNSDTFVDDINLLMKQLAILINRLVIDLK